VSTTPAAPPTPKGPIERALAVFADVRKGEAATALLLMLSIFFLLAAYYVLKPVRDSLITGVPNGAKYKSYMSAVIAVALLFAVPAYARFASSVARNKLLAGVGVFFVANLAGFWVLSQLPLVSDGAGQLLFALGFFLWVGIFNMMIIAQFWAFASDVYDDEQGKRLFPLIAIGQSVGSAVGSTTVSAFAKTLGTSAMFAIGAVLLALSTALTVAVSRREDHTTPAPTPSGGAAPSAPPPAPDEEAKEGPFTMVFKHRYLLLIAAFTTVFTLVNTNGEYVKDELIPALAAAEGAAQGLDKQGIADLRSALFGQFYNSVNIAGVLLQSFVVSRLVKYLGFRWAFMILPAIAFLDAAVIALAPVWSLVRVTKAAENATDYSLNNTLRNMLWLPTTRRMKYVAKQAVDTLFVRAGDVTSALMVLIFAQVLGLSVRTFGFINLALVAVWIVLALAIVRENARLVASKSPT
jgi:AAA family ATP:ADP antiporter